jgi:hypothetical protein
MGSMTPSTTPASPEMSLIVDGVDLPRARIHHDDRGGVIPERLNGYAAHFRVFARRVVAQDVRLHFVSNRFVECALARNGGLARDFRAARGLCASRRLRAARGLFTARLCETLTLRDFSAPAAFLSLRGALTLVGGGAFGARLFRGRLFRGGLAVAVAVCFRLFIGLCGFGRFGRCGGLGLGFFGGGKAGDGEAES